MRVAGLAVAIAALAAAGAASSAQTDRFDVHRLSFTRVDAQLVNSWGLATSGRDAWWVTNEARSTSTTYIGSGRKQAVTVSVPGGPTGIAFNSSSGFRVRDGAFAAPARFLYACEDGMIRGWSPAVPRRNKRWSSQAEVTVDASGTAAVFRGLTLTAGRLYAADFHNARVLVFDSKWRRIVRPGAFVDRSIPSWYAPFGIQAIGARIFVTYAWRAPVNGNDAPTGGYVDEFDLNGRLVAHVAGAKQLDEPWGLASAPRGFGRLGGDLLVANFGSGRITAYAPMRRGWELREQLPVSVPGVWGIAFGAGGATGSQTTLFYVAGPHDWHGASEVNVRGVFGSIAPVG